MNIFQNLNIKFILDSCELYQQIFLIKDNQTWIYLFIFLFLVRYDILQLLRLWKLIMKRILVLKIFNVVRSLEIA